MTRALHAVFGRALSAAMACAIVTSPSDAVAAKRRSPAMSPAFAGALFRAPDADGLTSRRRATLRLSGAADDLDDPFSDGSAAGSRGLELAPGWTAEASVYGAGRPDRSRSPLDAPTDGFSSRLTRSFGQGASLSSSVETDPSVMSTTLEARQEFRGTVGRGKAMVSGLEVGWAREQKVGHGLYASFAQGGVAQTRRGSSYLTRDALWINSKTSVEIAPSLSLTAEFEAETNSGGRMLLGYFGIKQNW